MAVGDIYFTYNGYTPDLPIDSYSVQEDDTSFTFTMAFLITVETAALLDAAVEAAFTALRSWNADLVIYRGGVSRTYSHTANTGYLGRPMVAKVGTPFDTGRSQRIQFNIRVGRPVKDGSVGGRRQGKWSIAREAQERHIITITAEYTATSGSPARSASYNILNNFQTYADAVMTALATDLGFTTYEIVNPISWDVDDQNKQGQASIQYREILANEVSGGVDTDLVMVDYSFDCTPVPLGKQVVYVQGPGLGAVPPLRFSCSYTALVKKTGTPTPTLQAKYIAAIEAFLRTSIQTRAGVNSGVHSVLVVEQRTPTFNDANRSITVSWSGYIMGGNLIVEYHETFSEQSNEGVWSEKIRDGLQDTHAVWSIGRDLRATHTVTITQYRNHPPDDIPDIPGWIKLSRTRTKGPFISTGIVESGTTNRTIRYSVPKYTRLYVKNYLYAVSSKKGGGGRKTAATPARG